ncbi:hypothetical protein [Rubrobacter marinus]|uniref:hypothetical protein n=1 Tax=Rubrobacter marinus TaxID=2653852 RepID=UPI001D17E6A5|nr:hypothetical protein [Rubrobacter marinus]
MDHSVARNGGVFLTCAVFGLLGVLLMHYLSHLCEPWAAGDLTSPGGDYEAVMVRDDCDINAGTVYTVTVARDADGFEEPGVDPVGGEGLSDGDAVRVRWASDDALFISGQPESRVAVVLRSSGVSVRRESP